MWVGHPERQNGADLLSSVLWFKLHHANPGSLALSPGGALASASGSAPTPPLSPILYPLCVHCHWVYCLWPLTLARWPSVFCPGHLSEGPLHIPALPPPPLCLKSMILTTQSRAAQVQTYVGQAWAPQGPADGEKQVTVTTPQGWAHL